MQNRIFNCNIVVKEMILYNESVNEQHTFYLDFDSSDNYLSFKKVVEVSSSFNIDKTQKIKKKWKNTNKLLARYLNQEYQILKECDQLQKQLLIKCFSKLDAKFEEMGFTKNGQLTKLQISQSQLASLMSQIESLYIQIVYILKAITNQLQKDETNQMKWKIKYINFAVLIDQRYPWLKVMIASIGIPQAESKHYDTLTMQISCSLRVFALVNMFYYNRLDTLKKDKISRVIYQQYDKQKQNMPKQVYNIKKVNSAETEQSNIMIVADGETQEPKKKKKKKNKNKNKNKKIKQGSVVPPILNQIIEISQQDKNMKQLNNFLQNMIIDEDDRTECRIQNQFVDIWKEKIEKMCKKDLQHI